MKNLSSNSNARISSKQTQFKLSPKTFDVEKDGLNVSVKQLMMIDATDNDQDDCEDQNDSLAERSSTTADSYKQLMLMANNDGDDDGDENDSLERRNEVHHHFRRDCDEGREEEEGEEEDDQSVASSSLSSSISLPSSPSNSQSKSQTYYQRSSKI